MSPIVIMSTSISSLGSAASSRPNSYTAHQHHIQQILAVTSASISVLFALLTFYSFMRVKILLFRHQYVMTNPGPASLEISRLADQCQPYHRAHCERFVQGVVVFRTSSCDIRSKSLHWARTLSSLRFLACSWN